MCKDSKRASLPSPRRIHLPLPQRCTSVHCTQLHTVLLRHCEYVKIFASKSRIYCWNIGSQPYGVGLLVNFVYWTQYCRNFWIPRFTNNGAAWRQLWRQVPNEVLLTCNYTHQRLSIAHSPVIKNGQSWQNKDTANSWTELGPKYCLDQFQLSYSYISLVYTGWPPKIGTFFVRLNFISDTHEVWWDLEYYYKFSLDSNSEISLKIAQY